MRNQPLHACIALSRDPETVHILIAQGADVNMEQAGGYTPLHQAAAAGLVDLTKILLEAGAEPDRRCQQGKTAADYARERSHHGVLQQLSGWKKETADPSLRYCG
jgi:ankyrin repeat protein